MQLSSSTLDVPTARSLLACFNSDGALEPIQKLFNRLTDSELEPLLALVNRHVLSDSHTLFQLERTYQDLLARGTLDQSLAQLGRLTENEEFVAALVVVLKDKYSSRYRGELLLALEELSKKLSAENVATGLDVGLTLAEARAAVLAATAQQAARGADALARWNEALARFFAGAARLTCWDHGSGTLNSTCTTPPSSM